MSACVPSAEFSHGDWLWSSAVELLRPELEWEKVQAPRVGNPFVVYNTFRDQPFGAASGLEKPCFQVVALLFGLRVPLRRHALRALHGRGGVQ